jgi:hypothetical protein
MRLKRGLIRYRIVKKGVLGVGLIGLQILSVCRYMEIVNGIGARKCVQGSYSRWCYDGDGALWSEYRQIYLKIRWREF